MLSQKSKPYRWLWWILVITFGIPAVIIRVKIPDNYWVEILCTFIPILLAQVITNFILRRKGLTQEARHAETWSIQLREQELPADLKLELYPPKWHLWVFTPASIFVVVAMFYVYFFVPPNQVEGREWALVIMGVFSLGGVFLWLNSIRPIIRVTSKGISGFLSRSTPWSEITAIRYEHRTNVQGEYTRQRLEILGNMGKLLTIYEIGEAPEKERVEFLQKLQETLSSNHSSSAL